MAQVALVSNLVGVGVDVGLNVVSRVGKVHPTCRRWQQGVTITKDIAYKDTGLAAHNLDIYRPEGVEGPLPLMFYVHGGGFRILSKDTHWMFGTGFARLGFTVVSINYRLAPAHPFPAAVEDTSDALQFVLQNAGRFGIDASRIAYAGESAGANLILGLAASGAWKRPEPYAEKIYDLNPAPKAIIPACGFLQVSNPERYLENESIPAWMRGRIVAICRDYLPEAPQMDQASLADPLLVFEEAGPPDRPLPAAIAPCGTNDPVLQDSRRLGEAFKRFDMTSSAPEYDGGMHAFHAVVWRQQARDCWLDMAKFLAEQDLVTDEALSRFA